MTDIAVSYCKLCKKRIENLTITIYNKREFCNFTASKYKNIILLVQLPFTHYNKEIFLSSPHFI